jgi:radical SAM superfamily enzyme YgiQ (UPF0313 family)
MTGPSTAGRDQARISIGLAQVNNSFANASYFPLSVGMLQAYAQRHSRIAPRLGFLRPIFRREPVADMVAQLAGADIVAISCYVWNEQISLALARELKKLPKPPLVVCGGPQVPNDAEAYLAANPCVDVAMHGEGEAVFTELLDAYDSRDWSGVQAVSYRQDGRFVHNPRRDNIEDLATIPSPYLEGVFDGLIAAHPTLEWLGLWETNRGCPFTCAYCDWGSATCGKVRPFDLPRVLREADWFAEHKIEFIFCCDGNYGLLKRDEELTRYVAELKKKHGYPQALSVQNTKNATDRSYNIQKILSDAGLNKGVTLALQSVDPTTLKNVGRQNVSLKSFEELQRRFSADGIETYSDFILCLPGETYESYVAGTSATIENGQHNRIQFINLSILPNARMGDPAYQREFGLETVQSTIINLHGAISPVPGDVPELQQLVIASHSMPREAWVRARVFSWMVSLLHFDKVFQIPGILLHGVLGVPYRELFEAFLKADPARHPVIGEIVAFFEKEARSIQAGGPEYYPAPQYLGVFWPHDEYVFIRLNLERKIEAFYAEARDIAAGLLAARGQAQPAWLDEAIGLNRTLLRSPFFHGSARVDCGANIYEYYLGVLRGTPVALEAKPSSYQVDSDAKRWDDLDLWMREVVWYGNKKGLYTYKARPV